MGQATFRAAVYGDRIVVQTPEDMGPVTPTARNHDGGVMITLQKDPNGSIKGTHSVVGSYKWSYAWKQSGPKLPRIGVTDAQLIRGLTEDGVLELFVPAGKRVMEVQRGPRKPKPAPAPAEPQVSEMRRHELVRCINTWKDEMGDALVLEITSEGKLRALVEYG